MEQTIQSCSHGKDYLALRKQGTIKYRKTRFIKKIPITLEHNMGSIKPTAENDDFNDIKEILSMISPRELSKPHHEETTATLLAETRSIHYNNTEYKDHSLKSRSKSPETPHVRNVKNFIIRNIQIKHKSKAQL